MIKNCSASGAAAPDPASHTPINYTYRLKTCFHSFFDDDDIELKVTQEQGLK